MVWKMINVNIIIDIEILYNDNKVSEVVGFESIISRFFFNRITAIYIINEIRKVVLISPPIKQNFQE